MKFILKTIAYIVFFLTMILILLPKENLYYMGQNKLENFKVELTQDIIDESNFGLTLGMLKIKYDNIEVANISKFDITTYLLSTKIDIKNIIVDNAFTKFVPQGIKFLSISHSILDPLKIHISSKFSLGSLSGNIDILNRVIKLNLTVSKSFRSKYRQIVRSLKRVQKKDKKEEYYSYEYKF